MKNRTETTYILLLSPCLFYKQFRSWHEDLNKGENCLAYLGPRFRPLVFSL